MLFKQQKFCLERAENKLKNEFVINNLRVFIKIINYLNF